MSASMYVCVCEREGAYICVGRCVKDCKEGENFNVISFDMAKKRSSNNKQIHL